MRTPWFPIAAQSDLRLGHIFQAELLGQELAVWRASDGTLNIWENRCPHRGVRLTLGTVIEDVLRCRYHGWSFASAGGACTQIPAHPGLTPARSVRAVSHTGLLHAGLVWCRMDGGENGISALSPVVALPRVLRAIPFWQSAQAVEAVMAATRFSLSPDRPLVAEICHGLPDAPSADGLQLFVQPTAPDRCVVRGLLHADDSLDDDAALRHLDDILTNSRLLAHGDAGGIAR